MRIKIQGKIIDLRHVASIYENVERKEEYIGPFVDIKYTFFFDIILVGGGSITIEDRVTRDEWTKGIPSQGITKAHSIILQWLKEQSGDPFDLSF